jgi:hypothetical protein
MPFFLIMLVLNPMGLRPDYSPHHFQLFIKIYPQSRGSPQCQSAILFLQIFYKTIWETPKHDTTKQYNIIHTFSSV